MYGGPQTKLDILTMTVNVLHDLIVITGDSTMKQGQCLGLYSYDPEHCCYKLVATEEHWNPAEREHMFIEPLMKCDTSVTHLVRPQDG